MAAIEHIHKAATGGRAPDCDHRSRLYGTIGLIDYLTFIYSLERQK
jgi:hypothetical protein